MIIISIDPGSAQSAYIIIEAVAPSQPLNIIDKGKVLNNSLLQLIYNITASNNTLIVYEEIKCYGMPVGQSVIDTCYFIGRMIEAATSKGVALQPVTRQAVKAYTCGKVAGVRDTHIRQAMIDRHGRIKGVTADVWSALAIATYYYDNFFNAASSTHPRPKGSLATAGGVDIPDYL